MATFAYQLERTQKRSDGTRNVRIRVIHNRQTARISTQIYVKDTDITIGKKGVIIKNQIILTQVNQILDDYRRKANSLGISCLSLSVKEVVSILKRKEGHSNIIDFIAFSRSFIEQNKKAHPGTMMNYSCAVKSLEKYLANISGATCTELNILDINHQFLTGYVAYMNKRSTSDSNRAVCLYLACIRHLHKQARFRYNRPEEGKILIPFNPFEFFKIPTETAVQKRAITKEQIQAIHELPYQFNRLTRTDKATPIRERSASEKDCRYNLAKDMFLLSFCLIGINSADIYSCTSIQGNVLTYNREKTKSRRSDRAEMRVTIPAIASPLINKYRDPSGTRVFRFYQQYSTAAAFNAAINKGLKQIGAELGIPDLEFYAARHSWATIARNDLRIDKYTVHQALNHVDADMKVTDRYITRTFAIENEANEKVIQFVFGK